jgi:GntR family transcriptional regulator
MYGVSTGTLRKAIDLLVADGRLIRSQGRGTYIRRLRFDSSLFRFFCFKGLHGEAVRPSARVIYKEFNTPGPIVKKALNLEEDIKALRLERLRMLDHVSVLAEEIWLPLHRFQAIADLRPDQFEDLLYPMYERCCHQVVASAKETLSVDQADARIANTLNIPIDTPLIKVQRTAFDYAGSPIEWRNTVGSAIGFEYQIEIR